MNADHARFNLRFAIVWLVATVPLLTLGNAEAFNRIFDLHLQNGTTQPVTFTILMGTCYQGTGYYPPNQLAHGPIQPGGKVTIQIARVQGHGCDGEQGRFAIQPSTYGGELQQFWFDNAGILDLTSFPNGYDGLLSVKSPVDETYTWTMRDTDARLSGPLDERLTMPRNYIAGDHGNWAMPITRQTRFDPIPGQALGNFYNVIGCPNAAVTLLAVELLAQAAYGVAVLNYPLMAAPPIFALINPFTIAVAATAATPYVVYKCEEEVGPDGKKVWHTQHVVRLRNKNGRAYFMVAQSYQQGGWISLLQTGPDAIDGNDLLKGGTPGGQYIWQDRFASENRKGSWNHPGKMELIGDLLVVSTQDWSTILMSYSNDFERILGGSEDGLLFYDVRDPEFPRYIGRITATELGIAKGAIGDNPSVEIPMGPFPSLTIWEPYYSREIASVSIFRSPSDEWFLIASGTTGKAVWKSIAGNGIVGAGIANWTEFPNAPDGAPTGSYGMTFNSLELHQPQGGQEKGLFFFPGATEAAPNITFGYQEYQLGADPIRPGFSIPVTVQGTENDWNTPSIYVTRKGMPVIYAIQNAAGAVGTLIQVHSQANLDSTDVWNQSPPIVPGGVDHKALHPDRTVTSCADSGVGSLRSAIGYGGRITFALPPNCGNTITLTGGPLVIYLYDVDIDASSTGVTINGGGRSRVFQIQPGITVRMNGLTIEQGHAVGSGALPGTGKGGGIYNRGNLTVRNSTIRFNHADAGGGGIASDAGSVLLENCTIAGNSSAASPLPGSEYLPGAGILNWQGSDLHVRHCTVAGNTTEASLSYDGAGIFNVGTLRLENSIVANNLKLIAPDDLAGSYTAIGANLIRTGSGARLGGAAPITGDPLLAALRYNDNGGDATPTMGLSPQSPAINAAVASTITTDQRGLPRPIGSAPDLGAVEVILSSVSPAPGQTNVSLRPTLSWTPVPGATFEVLFDFGSGFVSLGQTSSASMELGTALAPNTQYTWRVTVNFAGRRFSGDSQSFTTRGTLVVTTLADENDSGLGQGSGNSLRELIVAALPGETITFAPALSGQTIALGGTQLAIAKSLTIDASSLPDGIRIDARGNSRVFAVSGTGTVEMRKLTLTGGYSSFGGAVINDGAALTLYGSALTNNRSPDFGGGIYNRNGGALAVRFSTLSGNSAPQGGGIYHDGAGGSNLSVQSSTLADNYASSQGGGLFVTGGGTPRIETSTLARNAANKGGGLFIQGGTMLVQNSTLAGNSSIADQGAAILSESSANLTLRHVTVAKNIGVGIMNVAPAVLTLDNSIVGNNFNGLNTSSDLIGNFTAVGANLVRVRAGTLLAGPAPITPDPLLDDLGSYGYATHIMEPLVGSPVINAGVATANTPDNDQTNSALRINGGAPDLGAVESILSSNATLAWLTTSAGTITPAFQPLLTSYTATVASTVSTAAVRPSQANFTATVQVRSNGGAYVSVNQGEASPALPLNPGENAIDVKVLAADGVTTKVYTLAVIRGAPSVRNANLASLTTGSGTLAPAFSPAVSSYHVTVANATASTTVTAVAADALATIALRANVGVFGPLASGAASAPIPLNVGANPIDVRVMARDGITTATYRLVVTREAPAASNANLAALSTSAGALSPGFASGLAFYNVNVADAVTGATVTASPVQPTATIAVRANGGAFSNVASGVASAPMTLNADANVLEVKLTAQDGVTVRSYQIIVNRIVDDIEWASKRRLAPQAGGNDQSLDAAISSDGRFVAFSSRATNLVDGDTNNREDVFVYDRSAQTVERVSVNNAGVQGNHDSGHPSISADGRFVAFQSRASNLVANDTNGQIDASRGQDIFVYDRTAKTIERVSLRDNGGESNGSSETPSISGDGRYVAFASGANNLVTGYANGQVNVYIHDRTTHGIVGISVPLGAFVANRNSLNPVISTDGNVVAFEFAVDKSVDSTPAYQYRDIYVYNRSTGVVKRVTGTDDGLLANGNQSRAPSISADGRLIAFQSNLANIDFYDANGRVDVFVHDQIDGVTRLVSVDRTGTVQCVVGGCDATNPSISGDGRRVAFQSGAPNLVTPNTNGNSHIFMKDLDTGEISVLTVNSVSAEADGDSASPAVSFDGRAVAFESLATNLASPDTNGNYDVFVSATAAPAASALADLSSLVASVGAFTPLFSPGITSYSVGVANSVDTVLVRPTAADPNATIALRVNSGAFAAIASDAISAPLNLNLGANSIEVKVTAQNGTTTKSYIATVTRAASSNAELASLVALTDAALALTPAFAGGTTSYAASVAKGTTTVTVIPTAAHAGATVKVNGVSVNSGTASGPIGLAVGNINISTVVTAADGATTKSYVLTVTRAANTPPVAYPRTIAVAQGGEVPIQLTGTDADGDALTSSIVTLPTRGRLDQSGGRLVYKPNAGVTGADSFTFKVSDGGADSAAAVVTLEVLPQAILAPTVATGAASAVTANGATLNGAVASNGASTTISFQYGQTAAYGSTATATPSSLSTGAAAVTATISGLTCNTLYHFRAVGANSAGPTNGTDATFTTAACNALGVPLNVALAGSGGEVTSNPLGITCGADCSGDYPVGTVVTLIATPDAGSVFSGWGGSCTGARICTLAMSAARFVAAAFTFTGTGSAAANEWVQKAYVSYYGRPADPGGLGYWAGRMDAEGGSLSSIIASFGNSDEFNRRYGGLSYVALVTKIYQQALGRDPEPAGLDYYVGELQAGRRTLQSITLDVLNGATGLDALTVANRLDVANHYTGKVAVGCAYGTEATGLASLTPVNHDWMTAWTSKLTIETRCGN